MEFQNNLGIYLSKNSASVVCFDLHQKSVLGCFSVSCENTEQSGWQAMVNLISSGCAERGWGFSEVAVALDCAMFMQHSVHSEFAEPKQIAATIRFDTEEAIAADVADVAIAFTATPAAGGGSELTVFTAEKKMLTEILAALQSNNLDPVSIEPDVNCLARFISKNNVATAGEQGADLFAVLSKSRGYFIVLAKSQSCLKMRTFLLGRTQNKTELITREAPLTLALLSGGENINELKVFDSEDSVDIVALGEKLAVKVEALDLAWTIQIESQTSDDNDSENPVGFAIACGAAVSGAQKITAANFRDDFSPYQGRKLRIEKAIKILSVLITVFVLVIGMYFQMRLMQRNRYANRLHKKLAKQYSDVMFTKKMPKDTSPAKKLAGELRRIRDVKSGQLSITGKEAVSAKLILLLNAFNGCASKTNLQIDTIGIAGKITVAGSTSGRKKTLELFKAIKKGKLDILQQRIDEKGGRDNFTITVAPQNG